GDARRRADRSGRGPQRRGAGRRGDRQPAALAHRSRAGASEGDVTMALIELREVTKSYKRDANEISVLDGVSITVDEGDFLGLMGPSGSGKASLLILLLGTAGPSRGTIRIGGTEVSSLSERALAAWRARHIG